MTSTDAERLKADLRECPHLFVSILNGKEYPEQAAAWLLARGWRRTDEPKRSVLGEAKELLNGINEYEHPLVADGEVAFHAEEGTLPPLEFDDAPTPQLVEIEEKVERRIHEASLDIQSAYREELRVRIEGLVEVEKVVGVIEETKAHYTTGSYAKCYREERRRFGVPMLEIVLDDIRALANEDVKGGDAEDTNIMDLRGIAPDCTGGIESVEWVRHVRVGRTQHTVVCQHCKRVTHSHWDEEVIDLRERLEHECELNVALRAQLAAYRETVKKESES